MNATNPTNRKLTPEELRAHILNNTFLDPLWDASFKLLIADAAHPERLVHFLNALLRLEGPKAIVSATLRGTEQEVVLGFERKVIFDIHCITQAGQVVLVEFQRVGQKGFKDRMLYYSATAIRNAIQSGEIHYQLPQIYVLGLMNFTFQDHPGNWHHTVELVEKESGARFYPKLQFVFAELPNFNLKESELTTHEDMWLYALKTMGSAKEKPKELKGPIFEDLFEAARISKFEGSPMENIMSNLLDEAARNDELAYAYDSGKTEGIEQGVVRGREEGITLGSEKVQKQWELDKISTIEGMLSKGLDWLLIEDITHYNEASYQTLCQKHGNR